MFLANPSTRKLYERLMSSSLRTTIQLTSSRKFSPLKLSVPYNSNEGILKSAICLTVATAVTGLIVIGDGRYQEKKTICEPYDCSFQIDQATKLAEHKFATYWPRNIIILLGPPGAGKGTHGPKLTHFLELPQLSTGDILRAAVSDQTETGIKAESIMKSGGLVSDEIVISIIKDRIQQDDCKFGFILDGFPRTQVQATALDNMLKEHDGAIVTKVIELNVPDEILEERICGRWIHKASGRVYHIKYAPPKSMKYDRDGKTILKETMTDDITGELLYQRPDDTASALIKRLRGYHNDTEPILDHYESFGTVKRVNANQSADIVWNDIMKALSREGKV